MDHPSAETLKRFACGAARPEEGRAMVAHLLKGCTACAARLKALIEPAPVARQAYEGVLDRLDAKLLPEMLGELERDRFVRAEIRDERDRRDARDRGEGA